MGCACQNKWLVVDKTGKIVHRAKTEETAQAVADRNTGDLQVMHQDTHRKLQAAKRAANGTGGRGVTLEVVTPEGKVLTTTTHRPTADRVAARYAKIGATVRPAAKTSTTTMAR